MLDADEAIDRMASQAVTQGVDIRMPMVRGNALVHRVRNLALKKIRPDADFVLFCDDDMAPKPDALMRLIAHDVPVVSGYCTTRDEWPPKLVAKAYRDGQFYMMERMRPNILLSGCFGVGAAFLLVKRAVIEEALEYHLSALDWIAENREAHNRMSVRTERREVERKRLEGIRRELYVGEGLHGLFRYSMQDNALERGEDLHFSWLLIQMGVPIAIDTGVPVQHIGHFPYGPQFLDVEDPKELEVA